MGGSFESGAGDDPNDLFARDDETDDEEASEDEADVPEGAGETETIEPDEGVSSSQEGSESEAEPESESGEDEAESGSDASTAMVDVESVEGLDAAQLAREFVPDTYDRPHPWALGRGSVNDGRAEKKTFFLQSDVLALEMACSQEVNEHLDGNVPLTDLRELALILAYNQPELLAEAAREWGAESA